MKHPSQLLFILSFGGILLLASLLYALRPPSFGPLPQNHPAMILNQSEKIEVMKALLDQNREEIRFYQDKLFTLSFTFSAALLGIVAFALKKTGQSSSLRRVLVAAGFVLGVFYLLFVRFADTAILENDKDLIGIQYALNLSQSNAYLAGGQVIYQPHDPTLAKHAHIRLIAIFNVLLVLASTFVLMFAPKVRDDGD